MNQGLKIKEIDFSEDFKRWIGNNKIIPVLEKEFFKIENSNADYAEKISVVLQMIEQAGRN